MAPEMNKIMQPTATTLWANLVLVTKSKDLKMPHCSASMELKIALGMLCMNYGQ